MDTHTHSRSRLSVNGTDCPFGFTGGFIVGTILPLQYIIMNVLFEITKFYKIFMFIIIYFLTLNQMMFHISTTNYKTNLVICKKNSLRMQISQAIHVIIYHQCKVMAVNLCVQSKSNFLAQDIFFQCALSIPIGVIYSI